MKNLSFLNRLRNIFSASAATENGPLNRIELESFNPRGVFVGSGWIRKARVIGWFSLNGVNQIFFRVLISKENENHWYVGRYMPEAEFEEIRQKLENGRADYVRNRFEGEGGRAPHYHSCYAGVDNGTSTEEEEIVLRFQDGSEEKLIHRSESGDFGHMKTGVAPTIAEQIAGFIAQKGTQPTSVQLGYYNSWGFGHCKIQMSFAEAVNLLAPESEAGVLDKV